MVKVILGTELKGSCEKRHEVTNDDPNILTATLYSPDVICTTNMATDKKVITSVEDSEESKSAPYSPAPDTSGSKVEVENNVVCEEVHGKAADTSPE